MAAATAPLMSPMAPIDQSPWASAPHRGKSIDYDMFDDVELAQVRTQLQTFVSQHEDSSSFDFTEGSKAITRLHWVNSSRRSRCFNSKCKAKFTLTLRRHHCRKCGEVFCARCLSFQRKLSPTAEYDPNGKLFMVCSECFNSETQGPGQARIWTQTFHEMRRDFLLAHAEAVGHTTQKPSRAHLEKECRRLVEGFSKNLKNVAPSQEVRSPESEEGTGKNILMRKLSALKSHVSKVPSLVKTRTPEWKKPDAWTSDGPNCQFCSTPFTMTNKKHNCYICGRLACISCSVNDLLLYVPDKCSQDQDGKHARWAIIKVIGSPELEPDIRHYVRVCTVCREALETVQVQNYTASIKGEETEDCVMQMNELFDNIVKFQDKIDAWLPKYKQLIDALEIAGESPKALPASRSNMQTLAKHQGDLAEYFTSFVVAVSRLKKLKPKTNKELKLVKTLMRCKFTYYNDNMYTFRKLKRRLEQISPPEVLQAIQSIVDSQVTRRHTPRQTPNQTPRQSPNHTPRQTPNHTPRQTPNHTPRQTPNQTPRQTPEQAHRKLHRQLSLDYDDIDLDNTEIDEDLEEFEKKHFNLEEGLAVGRDRVSSKGQTPGSSQELTWMWRMFGRVSSSGRKPTLIRQMAVDGPEQTLESEVVGTIEGGSITQTDPVASKPSTDKPEQTVVKGSDGHTGPQSLTVKQGKTLKGAGGGMDEVDSLLQTIEETRKSLPGQMSVAKMVGWVSSKVKGSTLSLDSQEQIDKKEVDETDNVQGQMDSSDSKKTRTDKREQNDNGEGAGAGNVEALTDPQTSQQLAKLPGQTVDGGNAGMDEVDSKKQPLVKTLASLPGQISMKKMVGWVNDKVKRNSLSLDNQEQIDKNSVDEMDSVQGPTDPSASKRTEAGKPEQTDKKDVLGRDDVVTDLPTSKQRANLSGLLDEVDSDIRTLEKTSESLTGQISLTRMVGWVNSWGQKASPNLANQEQTDKKGVVDLGIVQDRTGTLAMQSLAEEPGKTDKGKVVYAGNVETHRVPQASQHTSGNPGQNVEEEVQGRDELDSKPRALTKMFSWVNPKGKKTVPSHEQTSGKVAGKSGNIEGQTDPLVSKPTTDKPGQTVKGKVVRSVNIETDRVPQTSQHMSDSVQNVKQDVPGRDGVDSISQALQKTGTGLRGQIAATKMFGWVKFKDKETAPNDGQTGEKVVTGSGNVEGQTDPLASKPTTDKPGQTVKREVVGIVNVKSQTDPLALQPPRDTSRVTGQVENVGESEVDSKPQAQAGALKRFSKQIWATKVLSRKSSKGEKPASNAETLTDDQEKPKEGK